MVYTLDSNRIINEDMKKGKTFVHQVGARVKVFPYRPDYKEELQNLQAVVGEVARQCIGKKVKEEVEEEQVIQQIKNKVDSKQSDVLTKFIEELYFTEQGKLELFHPKVFAFSSLDKNCMKDQKELGKFLYDVLFKEVEQEALNQMFEKGGDILVQLIISVLPDLEALKRDESSYQSYAPQVGRLFKEDLTFLLQNHKNFIKYFEMLLKYYYFFYASQAMIKINQRQKADLDSIEQLYFRVQGEEASKNRACYLQGFKVLQEANENLFANVMLLQFLNYDEKSEERLLIPQWYKKYSLSALEEEKAETTRYLKDFICQYKEAINIKWDGLKVIYKSEESDIEKALYELFRTISYQFTASGRKSAAEKYKKWFYQFCISHYLERRGTLGYMLTLKDEEILFLAGICINGQEKIRLGDLFVALESRGLFFDELSREHIIALFEKRNLLEKKSDSGDAQYVRAIL